MHQVEAGLEERRLRSYAIAASLDPSKVDFSQEHSGLGARPSRRCITDRGIVRHLRESCTAHKPAGVVDAPLVDRICTVRDTHERRPKRCDRVPPAVELFPAYVNSWYTPSSAARTRTGSGFPPEAIPKPPRTENWNVEQGFARRRALPVAGKMNLPILE
jgi:hypothetical protein